MPGSLRNKTMTRRGSKKIMEAASKLQYPTPSSPSEVTLPKLPVPDLQETLDQYLLCVRPLVNEGQFEQTKRKVDEFGRAGGIGEKIQHKLIEHAEKQENWAYEWWLNDMYLDARVPLPVNSNPGMVLPKQDFKDESSMLRYASKLVSGILDFKVILDARALPVDVARGQLAGQPLCMEQYYRLLTSYRLPGYGRDQLVTVNPNPSEQAEHIIVMCNNQLFVVPISEGNRRLTEADFYVQLELIMRNGNNCSGMNSPIGVLTSLNRNDWAEARELLMKDHVNRLSLDAVERSTFILCLDGSTNANSDVTVAHQMLYGSGPKLNSCNRWYDKTIQLIISTDGNVGLSYEHSASEGIAVTALIEHLIKYVSIQETKGLYRSDSMKTLTPPQHLKWKITDATSKFIQMAQSCAVEMSENLDLTVMRFDDYGKNFIKRQNISPDAFVQVALQVAYYKIYQRLVSTYESASTRRFQKGRVDNIRAASIQALDFAKALFESEDGTKTTDAKQMLLLRRAVKTQTDITIAAISGHGIDCHLLALKKMAEEMGFPVPEIFSDPSYPLTNYFQLSTSQIPTKTDSFMCYGAVVPDGYGVSYNPHGDSITFCISSFRTCPSTCSEKFGNALRESMLTMKDICQQWNKRRSSSLVSTVVEPAEHLVTPKKLPLHRSINVRHFSSEDDTLREEKPGDMAAESKAALLRNLKRRTSFTSTNALRSNEHLPAPFSSRTHRSNRFKLNRRFSDMAITRPSSASSHTTPNTAVISNELMELLRGKSIAT